MATLQGAISPVISINRESPDPFHRQIYDAYRAAILNGNLRPGQLVPSTRSLCQELKVSRMPVLTAYAQLLAEGYFETRVGVGTVISQSLPEQKISLKPKESGGQQLSGPRRVARVCELVPRTFRPTWATGRGAFNIGEVALDEFPHRVWAALTNRFARNAASSGAYGEPMGMIELRTAIADYLRTARAVSCDPSQIMIVSGSQQAVTITTRVLLNPGDAAWVEEPGYTMIRDVLNTSGCHPIPVPVDDEGLDVRAGIRTCRNARVAFVTPSHQYPLGATMSLRRRLELLNWAQRSGAWIVEDDFDSEYRYDSMPIASLQGLDQNSRVIYVGTFSKVLYPALRLGYLVIPADLVQSFYVMRRINDLCTSTLQQQVVSAFIREGHFARHIRRMRTLYGERRRMLVELLQSELGGVLEVVGSDAGMHLAAFLLTGEDDVEKAKEAAQQRLWLWPLSSCYATRPARQGFTFGFASLHEKEIEQAIRVLRGVLRST